MKTKKAKFEEIKKVLEKTGKSGVVFEFESEKVIRIYDILNAHEYQESDVKVSLNRIKKLNLPFKPSAIIELNNHFIIFGEDKKLKGFTYRNRDTDVFKDVEEIEGWGASMLVLEIINTQNIFNNHLGRLYNG